MVDDEQRRGDESNETILDALTDGKAATIKLHDDFGLGHEPGTVLLEDVEIIEGQLTLPCRCTPEQKARFREKGDGEVCLPCEARAAANRVHNLTDKLL